MVDTIQAAQWTPLLLEDLEAVVEEGEAVQLMDLEIHLQFHHHKVMMVDMEKHLHPRGMMLAAEVVVLVE